MTEEEVEAVARAFYESLDDARSWRREPEWFRERFRLYARIAIAAVDERENGCPSEIKPLVIAKPLQEARSYFMEATGVSVLAASSFRAVLRGPNLIYDAVDAGHSRFVGPRDLLNKPVSEALIELTGQGYLELLERVFTTGKVFFGEKLPLKVQKNRGGSLEERIIDIVYRPIQNPSGEILGIFVEGCDRTHPRLP
jgi:hypothetical protein